eukprot:TRINITY_DN1578_c0_g1_i1.p1 TRINITY_DN1578_c0_g1~~TRINITY_DN1578_c0_g1_i1.p1  ORF type:complete len:185 (+),score=19.47 TRINITY_DN1578_c0_g1_i1:33-587(+)
MTSRSKLSEMGRSLRKPYALYSHAADYTTSNSVHGSVPPSAQQPDGFPLAKRCSFRRLGNDSTQPRHSVSHMQFDEKPASWRLPSVDKLVSTAHHFELGRERHAIPISTTHNAFANPATTARRVEPQLRSKQQYVNPILGTPSATAIYSAYHAERRMHVTTRDFAQRDARNTPKRYNIITGKLV